MVGIPTMSWLGSYSVAMVEEPRRFKNNFPKCASPIAARVPNVGRMAASAISRVTEVARAEFHRHHLLVGVARSLVVVRVRFSTPLLLLLEDGDVL